MHPSGGNISSTRGPTLNSTSGLHFLQFQRRHFYSHFGRRNCGLEISNNILKVTHSMQWGLDLNPSLPAPNLDSTHHLYTRNVLRDSLKSWVTWSFLLLIIARRNTPGSHHSSQNLVSPVQPSCTAELSSFSGSSPSPTPRSLLILSSSWAEKGSSPHHGTCHSYSLAVQQNLSFLTSVVFSSSRFRVQLLSTAEAWLGASGSGLRVIIY